MNRILTITSLAFIVAACTSSSGVLPFGPDTYKISVGSELGGFNKAQRIALTEANAHCMQNDRQMMPVNTQKSRPRDFVGDAIPHFELTFRCLAQGDQELTRPTMKRDSDIIIERR